MSGYYERGISPDMHESKTASATLEIKQLEENGIFAGYASVFNVVDSQKDIIQRGAFKRTITQRQGNIKLLWQHHMNEPIGVIEELREDERGLYIKARLMMEVARAREAYALLKRSVVNGLSIGYTPRRYHQASKSGVRTITDIDLWEVSIVTFPANEAALITVVKGHGGESVRLQHSYNKVLACIHGLV